MKFKTKGFTSLLLTCLFATAAFSGVILYMTPRGRVANWTGWTMLGLDKHGWGALHINACLLFLLVAFLHLFLNFNVFWSYIRKRSSGFNLKLEMVTALLVTTALVVGTLYDVPPLSSTMTLNERIKNYWESEAPSSPAPHAEEFTLTRFASTVGLTVDDIKTALNEEGFQVSDNTNTIGLVAEANQITPNQLFTALKKHHPEIRMGMGRGRGPGAGPAGSAPGQNGGFGGGCSKQGEGKCSGTDHGDQATAAADHDAESGWGPGRGMGRGPGGGMGRGMGMGMGRGSGAGMGRGWGRDHEGESQRPQQDVE